MSQTSNVKNPYDISFRVFSNGAIIGTCDICDTDYNTDNWEPGLMTIFVTWQLIVTMDSICNSCDVLLMRTWTKGVFDPIYEGQSWLEIWWKLLRDKAATKRFLCQRFFRPFLLRLPFLPARGGGTTCLSRLSACDMSVLSRCLLSSKVWKMPQTFWLKYEHSTTRTMDFSTLAE